MINIDFQLNDEFQRLENKINDLQIQLDDFNIDLLDLINVQINNDFYIGIDDIFKSYTGKYYIKVFIKHQYVEVNIDKINFVMNIDGDSDIVKNWLNIKSQIKRGEKIKRLL